MAVTYKNHMPLSPEALTAWLPDESLYSWCSRYHITSCNHRNTQTNIKLFGSVQIGSTYDFPFNLANLVFNTAGILGSVEEIIQHHTLLPFFLAFHKELPGSEAIQLLETNNVKHLKARLGLSSGKYRSEFPLKLCPICFDFDIKEYGTAYWHTHHQLPGTWICIKHSMPLLELPQEHSTCFSRYDWKLPIKNSSTGNSSNISDKKIQISLNFAYASSCLFDMPIHFKFDTQKLKMIITNKLMKNDFSLNNNSISRKQIGNSLFNFYNPIKETSDYFNLLPSPGHAGRWFFYYLYHINIIKHPLHHILMILWLFEDWNQFSQSYFTLGDE